MMMIKKAEVRYPCPFYLRRGRSSTMNMKHRQKINEDDDVEKGKLFCRKRKEEGKRKHGSSQF